ncbi:MAG: helix-turn-helix domain-containing protein [Ruminococcaceae bacterium]|nr:helix-turn-helix domain-containing protein [Oscillospiraceae bacterium]
MNYNYSIELLNKVMKDFSIVTGNNIALYDVDFNILGCNYANRQRFCAYVQSNKTGKERCSKSDRLLLERCAKEKVPQTHICHAGLIDICIPIKYNNSVIAYIVLGQIKNDISFKGIAKYVKDLELDYKTLEESYNSIPYADDEKIQSVISIAVMLTEYILYNDMIKPRLNISVELATKYIDENYTNEITVSDICKAANISKSVLYKNFSSYLSQTPVDYINKKRVDKACKLLLTSNLSIENIMSKVGFSNISYFYKRFKELKGITPKQYRLQNKENLNIKSKNNFF